MQQTAQVAADSTTVAMVGGGTGSSSSSSSGGGNSDIGGGEGGEEEESRHAIRMLHSDLALLDNEIAGLQESLTRATNEFVDGT